MKLRLEEQAKQLSKELAQLARLRGWRECPTCKVYVEKNDGCDHMFHPACNSHFCYQCGMGLVDGSTETTTGQAHWGAQGCRINGSNPHAHIY
jgi:hypothetical protein